MHPLLDTTGPALVPIRSQCAASELDVVGLSAIALLEWMAEPARECFDASDRRVR